MKRPKISIIGGGFVGSTTAHWLLNRGLGDIVLLDIAEDMVRAKALDLLQSSPLTNSALQIKGTANYEDIKDSQIVIVTAGLSRKPGMSREELQSKNSLIMKNIAKNIKAQSPEAKVIMVTNPLDIMTYTMWKYLDFPKRQVIGMAGVLDSARFKTFISEELNVSPQDIQAFVLGGHGDTMVPLPRLCHVGGVPLLELLPNERVQALVERTRKGGAEIVSLLKTGSAYYAPARSVTEMVEAILKDQKRILPCSAFLDGEYGEKGFFMGVLCLLGKKGVEKIIEFALTEQEKKEFQLSALAIKKQLKNLEQSP